MINQCCVDTKQSKEPTVTCIFTQVVATILPQNFHPISSAKFTNNAKNNSVTEIKYFCINKVITQKAIGTKLGGSQPGVQHVLETFEVTEQIEEKRSGRSER